ncbi:hypothetical protein OsJ_27161 [Oryza sativa Japonica Group]|uniref:Uncharacterized protein n=1 Tax=Oryza sativa subsp. japonica TaxID=39947 RepID=B9G0Q1_ORYSJ|nr:hypothetical protein OsJ_27161 [Oryza sativa Japonica Group]
MGSAAAADPAASASRPQQEAAAGEQGRRWGAREQEVISVEELVELESIIGREKKEERQQCACPALARMRNPDPQPSGEQPNSERCFAHRTSSRGPPEGWGGRKVGERRGGGVSGRRKSKSSLQSFTRHVKVHLK